MDIKKTTQHVSFFYRSSFRSYFILKELFVLLKSKLNANNNWIQTYIILIVIIKYSTYKIMFKMSHLVGAIVNRDGEKWHQQMLLKKFNCVQKYQLPSLLLLRRFHLFWLAPWSMPSFDEAAGSFKINGPFYRIRSFREIPPNKRKVGVKKRSSAVEIDSSFCGNCLVEAGWWLW